MVVMAYQLALPPHVKIDDYFHVSFLKKYVINPSHVLTLILYT
jgi:hypothetical protein